MCSFVCRSWARSTADYVDQVIGGGRLVLRIYGIGLAPREKLGDDPRNPRLLKTVRGVGYMLAAASSSETPQ